MLVEGYGSPCLRSSWNRESLHQQALGGEGWLRYRPAPALPPAVQQARSMGSPLDNPPLVYLKDMPPRHTPRRVMGVSTLSIPTTNKPFNNNLDLTSFTTPSEIQPLHIRAISSSHNLEHILLGHPVYDKISMDTGRVTTVNSPALVWPSQIQLDRCPQLAVLVVPRATLRNSTKLIATPF